MHMECEVFQNVFYHFTTFMREFSFGLFPLNLKLQGISSKNYILTQN
jgi:hypothetical protein